MGKKKEWGVNEKVVEARERKQNAKVEARDKVAKAKDDAYWSQHENPKGRKDAKREEQRRANVKPTQERKRDEAAARKAEARRLAAEEEAALFGGKKAALQRPAPPKVTAHQLRQMREREQREEERAAAEKDGSRRREVTEDAYAAALEVENLNRAEGVLEARSLDAALDVLSVSDPGGADRHPEKRAKAAWEAYYAEQLPDLKASKPGLRLMQYKSMIFDTWQRSPANPRNQRPTA